MGISAEEHSAIMRVLELNERDAERNDALIDNLYKGVIRDLQAVVDDMLGRIEQAVACLGSVEYNPRRAESILTRALWESAEERMLNVKEGSDGKLHIQTFLDKE